MALPASGAISLNQVNTELGLTATATITMNDAAVRTLFGVASGAIGMNSGYGKSNRVSLSVSYTTNTLTPQTLNLNSIGGYVAGKSNISINFGANMYMYSNSTGSPAFNITGGTSGDTVSLTLSATSGGIMGKGGNGASNRASIAAAVGGPALQISYPITINLPANATLGGGGGGGGGGGTWRTGPAITVISGGGGGGGQGGGNGGPAPASSPGTINYSAGVTGGAGATIVNGNGVAGGGPSHVGGGGGGGGNSGAGGGGAAAASGGGGGTNHIGIGGSGGTNTYLSSTGGTGGSFSAAATNGSTQASGGGGGGWGSSGGAGRTASAPTISIAAATSGAAGGKAINTQGNIVTLTGTPGRVKGIVG